MNTQPIKEAELRTLSRCARCERLIGETGIPVFWKVSFERHGLKINALRRQTGLAIMLESAALAMVMGPDEPMTEPLTDRVTVMICDSCGLDFLEIAGRAEIG